MHNLTITKPEPTEYAPHYEQYISLVSGGDVLRSLSQQLEETLALLATIPETKAESRYAPDKWSIKELVGHVIDAERIFGYRAMRFARNDNAHLPGFEQDDYIRNASFDEYQLTDLAAEFEHLRRSHLSMFNHLDAKSWERVGIASNNEVSVRALGYIIAGHELHHRNVLQAKYL